MEVLDDEVTGRLQRFCEHVNNLVKEKNKRRIVEQRVDIQRLKTKKKTNEH